MASLQNQILELFDQCAPDMRDVITSVIQFELENIHLTEPRYKTPILDILDRVAKAAVTKEDSDEA
jgi:hypothetical protein